MSGVNGDDDGLYLGLDLSTQSLTAVAINTDGRQTHAHSVNFVTDLHHHRLPIHRAPFATVRSTLFIEALDVLFGDLKAQKFPFHLVRGVSGDAQQHSSVFLTGEFSQYLQTMSPSSPMLPQIPISAFAFPDGPTWEDTSTADECAVMEMALGGPVALAVATGARGTLRFTGPQILARSRRSPERFAKVRRVALVSAFLGSLFAGVLIPEDVADASGTLLFDIGSDPPRWFPDAVRVANADGLLALAPVTSYSCVGYVSDYLCKRYGFSDSVPLTAFTGDNPATIAAVGGLCRGDILVSMGTSDTAQWLLDEGEISVDEHGAEISVAFRSPLTNSPSFIRMLVYSNGSLTREAVRDYEFRDIPTDGTKREITWGEFEGLVRSVPPGCSIAKVGAFYRRPEFAPRADPDDCARVVNAITGKIVSTSHAELCRLVLEWRALAIAAHLHELRPRNIQRVLLAGGAAQSQVIPQIVADVLNAPVFQVRRSASAAFGAARRARVGALQEMGQKVILAPEDEDSMPIAKPRPEIAKMYREVHLPAYQQFFEPAIKQSSKPLNKC